MITVKWKGIQETFRSVFKSVDTLTNKELRKRVTAMVLKLKALTPKDTGFASSRWEISGQVPRLRVINDASYIEYLNQGSSKQAPSFFIESVALQFGKPLGLITTVVPSMNRPRP